MYIIGKRTKEVAIKNILEITPEDKRIVYLSAGPKRHPNRDAARTEAERLARENKDYEFLIFELIEGVESVPAPVVHRKYS